MECNEDKFINTYISANRLKLVEIKQKTKGS